MWIVLINRYSQDKLVGFFTTKRRAKRYKIQIRSVNDVRDKKHNVTLIKCDCPMPDIKTKEIVYFVTNGWAGHGESEIEFPEYGKLFHDYLAATREVKRQVTTHTEVADGVTFLVYLYSFIPDNSSSVTEKYFRVCEEGSQSTTISR